MDAVGMSLDEIIQKKKNNKPSTGFRRTTPSKPRPNLTSNKQTFRKRFSPNPNRYGNGTNGSSNGGGGGGKIIDARNKIIQKNRLKIRDARDKLAQIAKRSGDARLRLIKKTQRARPAQHLHLPARGAAAATNQIKKRRPNAAPYIINRDIYVHNDRMDIDDDGLEYMPQSVSLRRTVKNDIALSKMPPLPEFSRVRVRSVSPPLWNSDPFDCYEIPTSRPADVSETKYLQKMVRGANLNPATDKYFHQVVMSTDGQPRKGILRASRDNVPMYSMEENASNLSYEMRTRLERPPDTTASMGMFQNPYNKPPAASQQQHGGFRIVVSNLHNSVTQSDILELFEDIGDLVEARLVRPGVAEVIFETLKDAETAVETYHNRQLDGQPMKCLLVNPRLGGSNSGSVNRSVKQPSAPVSRSSQPTKSTKSSLEIDIDALHKVLFRRN